MIDLMAGITCNSANDIRRYVKEHQSEYERFKERYDKGRVYQSSDQSGDHS